MRSIRRKLILADHYQEFQNSVLPCTAMTLRELKASKKQVTISEIRELSKIDLSNKVIVGKTFTRYFPLEKAGDFYMKWERVKVLKDSAKKDVLLLDMLSRHGINDLKEWFYQQKVECS